MHPQCHGHWVTVSPHFYCFFSFVYFCFSPSQFFLSQLLLMQTFEGLPQNWMWWLRIEPKLSEEMPLSFFLILTLSIHPYFSPQLLWLCPCFSYEKCEQSELLTMTIEMKHNLGTHLFYISENRPGSLVIYGHWPFLCMCIFFSCIYNLVYTFF